MTCHELLCTPCIAHLTQPIRDELVCTVATDATRQRLSPRCPTAMSRIALTTACVSARNVGSPHPATTCKRLSSDCDAAGRPVLDGRATRHWLSERRSSHSLSVSSAGCRASAGKVAATIRKVQKRPLAMARGVMLAKATWFSTSIPALVMPCDLIQSSVADSMRTVSTSKRLHSAPIQAWTDGTPMLQSRAVRTFFSWLKMSSSSTLWAPEEKPMPESQCPYCVASWERATVSMTLLRLVPVPRAARRRFPLSSFFLTMVAIATHSSGSDSVRIMPLLLRQ
mmetsp:Transcript_60076/g.154667  ORF Transcript_60076/g.154667 Transcript_60076/m.154667 type:complete len:282 (+) Transcript_60076:115-960(+)